MYYVYLYPSPPARFLLVFVPCSSIHIIYILIYITIKPLLRWASPVVAFFFHCWIMVILEILFYTNDINATILDTQAKPSL
jgi:hypothetical protein